MKTSDFKQLDDFDGDGMIHDRFTISSTNLTKVGIWWLMASYVYYCRSDLESILEDKEFDTLTRILMTNFDKLADLEYKTIPNLVTMERLRAGTAYDLREHDYPSITRNAAVGALQDDYWSLEEVFFFQFPDAPRVERKLNLDEAKVHCRVGRDRTIDKIIKYEPSLQDVKYQTDEGLILQDRLAEGFYDGVMDSVMEKMKPHQIVGSFYFDSDVGWTVKVYDPTRYFKITVE